MFSLVLFSCAPGNNNGNNGIGSLFATDFVDKEAFREIMTATVDSVNEVDSAFRLTLLQNDTFNTAYAYQLSGREPLWFDSKGPLPAAEALPEQLNALWNEGLEPGAYRVGYIREVLTRLKDRKQAVATDSVVAWDKAFTAAWLQAARELLLGTHEIRRGDSLWFAGNDTAFYGAAYLVASLKDKGDFPAFDTFRSTLPEYLPMKEAVAQWSKLKEDSLYLQAKQALTIDAPDSTWLLILERELGTALPATDSAQGLKPRIAAYQYYRQLKITGKRDSATCASLKKMPDTYIHSLQLNMDRLRALPRVAGAEHVWVNIPLMEVSYYRDDAELFHSRVVVGKKSRQTPTLWAPMANVVFNPPWGVPPTILKKDVGPGVGRSGPAYLARKGLRAYDAKGRDVTDQVTGSNYKKFSYRQPPGAHNSLGEVKFNLPNKWDIYLHDTPHRENFGNRMRALSSGCVRVQNPKLLAEAILQGNNYTPEKIDSIIETRRTKFEPLKHKFPVYIVYLTVARDSTGRRLRYLDDVYGRDSKMKKIYGY